MLALFNLVYCRVFLKLWQIVWAGGIWGGLLGKPNFIRALTPSPAPRVLSGVCQLTPHLAPSFAFLDKFLKFLYPPHTHSAHTLHTAHVQLCVAMASHLLAHERRVLTRMVAYFRVDRNGSPRNPTSPITPQSLSNSLSHR